MIFNDSLNEPIISLYLIDFFKKKSTQKLYVVIPTINFYVILGMFLCRIKFEKKGGAATVSPEPTVRTTSTVVRIM